MGNNFFHRERHKSLRTEQIFPSSYFQIPSCQPEIQNLTSNLNDQFTNTDTLFFEVPAYPLSKQTVAKKIVVVSWILESDYLNCLPQYTDQYQEEYTTTTYSFLQFVFFNF